MQRISQVIVNFRTAVIRQDMVEIIENLEGAVKIIEAGGAQHEVFIRPKRRSNPQNDAIHKIYRELSKKTGHTIGEIKEWSKTNHLGMKSIEVGGVIQEIPRSTTDLSKEEASEYIQLLETTLAGL